jgi:hypothetical protein
MVGTRADPPTGPRVCRERAAAAFLTGGPRGSAGTAAHTSDAGNAHQPADLVAPAAGEPDTPWQDGAMTRLTVVIGGLLVVLGVVGYLATGATSLTALIPSLVGVLLLACAAIAVRRPASSRHAVHAALAIALVAAIGSLRNVAQLGDLLAGSAANPGAVVVSTIMFVHLVGYVGAGVRSFVAARRSSSPR